MRYLKTFESVDFEKDLRDFCETYLAYLLDDGDFELSVIWQGSIYNVVTPDKDYHIIKICKLDYSDSYTRATGFNWLQVKDYFIPFLHMLNNKYSILQGKEGRDVGSYHTPCISLYNGRQSYCVSVENVLSGDALPGRYDNIDLLEITIRVQMKNKLVE
jgi:hypothetical protein